MKRITAEDIAKALLDVRYGADVYGLADAKLYRDLEKLGLVNICPAMNAPKDAAKRQPYFGCIITDAGKAALREFKLRSLNRNTPEVAKMLRGKSRL